MTTEVRAVYVPATPEPPMSCSASEFMTWVSREQLLVGVIIGDDQSGQDIGADFNEVPC